MWKSYTRSQFFSFVLAQAPAAGWRRAHQSLHNIFSIFFWSFGVSTISTYRYYVLYIRVRAAQGLVYIGPRLRRGGGGAVGGHRRESARGRRFRRFARHSRPPFPAFLPPLLPAFFAARKGGMAGPERDGITFFSPPKWLLKKWSFC